MLCVNKPVLVTGGSIAANTLAWWLIEGGFDVTVDEKAPEFRMGGQSIDSIDVRGAGRTALGGSHPRLCNQMLEVDGLWEGLPSCA